MTILKSHGVIIPLQRDCGTGFIVIIVIRKSTNYDLKNLKCSWYLCAKTAVGVD